MRQRTCGRRKRWAPLRLGRPGPRPSTLPACAPRSRSPSSTTSKISLPGSNKTWSSAGRPAATPSAGQPSRRPQASRRPAVTPPAGHPPGVALLYTIRSCRLWSSVYSRATPGGWPASRSRWHPLTLLGLPLAGGLPALRDGGAFGVFPGAGAPVVDAFLFVHPLRQGHHQVFGEGVDVGFIHLAQFPEFLVRLLVAFDLHP